jgi:hypothetical protein
VPLTPKDHYTLLLKTFKGEGITIIHRALKNAGGFYCPRTNKITISTEYRNTLQGCYLLCHEYQHRLQDRFNEYPNFFKIPPGQHPFNEALFEEILDAEMEAVKKANVMLKMFGIPYSPNALTQDGYEEAKKFWREYYFKN